ncbi:Crp/Fnr family transcriptional regulator [Halomonas stenophila]|uniref:CRP-like cAMP-binding protein n=1 Tax=Halomonas stenophila TaxID=795312 RepID=A0A7W5ESE6_9GAMM|nr:Crp/Fnr family transcriptional regulator [Halomonas stenophila]MBB3229920.1 CRP-like cAMP-binding protein [Halomonas stenophila]
MSLLASAMGRYVALSALEERCLAALESHARPAAREQRLWLPHDRVGSLFVLQDGWACTIRRTGDGERQVIEVLLPGDIIGLREFTFRRHVSEARMITAGTLLPFPHEQIVDLVAASTPLAIALFAVIGRQEAILTERMLVTLHHSARSQVLHFILETFTRLAKLQPVTLDSFTFPVTQRLLGEILGLSPVHINRTLSALERDRLLKKHRTRVEVYDRARLLEEAAFDAAYLSDEMDGLRERLAHLRDVSRPDRLSRSDS